jgi:Glutamate decarboxylase and related PLP-dependent proteins
MPSDTDPAIKAVLDELSARLATVVPTNIGFPSSIDVDYSPLHQFFDRYMLNNLGDPFTHGAYPQNTKALEVEVVNFVADLMRAPADDRWGYVTSGAGEGNLYALHLARGLHPGGIVYYSEAAHYSVDKALDLLAMPSIRVRADHSGQINYFDLEAQVERNRDRPAIVVANIGTTMTEAMDDVRRIHQILDSLAIRRRYVHSDAALSGIPLALLDPNRRPGFDFLDGADSVIVSGHKFLGTPMPCGVVVVKESLCARLTRTGVYIGSPDTTITCSRSGHAALLIWYALRSCGIDGLRARAEGSRKLAAYTYQRLVDLGWDAWYNPLGFTVVLDTPPPVVMRKWALASKGGHSHVICMPGLTRQQIDDFVADLQAATAPVRIDGHRPAHNGVTSRLRATPATA